MTDEDVPNAPPRELHGMTRDEAQKLLDGATPGPWETRTAKNCGDVGITATGCGFFVEAYEDIKFACERDSETASANARLIAAAPDLARAYIAACDRIEALERERDELQSTWEDDNADLAVALLPAVTAPQGIDAESLATQIIDRSISRLRTLSAYAGSPAWDAVVAEEIRAALRQIGGAE